jgi:hypothetical protein
MLSIQKQFAARHLVANESVQLTLNVGIHNMSIRLRSTPLSMDYMNIVMRRGQEAIREVDV